MLSNSEGFSSCQQDEEDFPSPCPSSLCSCLLSPSHPCPALQHAFATGTHLLQFPWCWLLRLLRCHFWWMLENENKLYESCREICREQVSPGWGSSPYCLGMLPDGCCGMRGRAVCELLRSWS